MWTVDIRSGASGCEVGLSQQETAEVIWQTGLYGGFPASINAFNAAIEVFSLEDGSPVLSGSVEGEKQ